jgi:hypothetical protein
MITALPPAATTSAAVCRPIPLLPPATTSFWPANTGIDRPPISIWGCMSMSPSPCLSWSQFQFALIPAFLSDGCVAASLAAAARTHTVESDGTIWPRVGDADYQP